MGISLTEEQKREIAEAGWRSPVEFCRIILPNWFPTKMPWVHRGLAALRIGRADFLLDFGKEVWQEDIEAGTQSEWTVQDFEKLIANFVTVTKEAVYKDGRMIEPEVTKPMFLVARDSSGYPTGCWIADPKDDNAFIIPRGFSKTTLINALNLRDAVYDEEDFILYVSETKPHASNQVATIRTQLEENELLIAVYGDKKPNRQASEKWTDSFLELLGPIDPATGMNKNGCKIAALGSGGQVRGISKDATRPSRIIVDDFQSSESMKSPTQVAADIQWYTAVLRPARKIFGKGQTKMDVIGTLLGPQAIMALLMQDPDYNRVRFGALDRQGDPLWAYAVDHAKLTKLRAEAERMGNLDSFDFEYMSTIPINDGVAFPLDKIVYVNRPAEWFVAKAIVCDPAISENPKADFCAIGALGMGKYGDIHLIDFHGEVGMGAQEQADKFFDFHFAHCLDLDPDCVKHGIEAVAYQRALISLITSQQHERSKTWGQRAYFEITPILHGRHEGSKIMRVQGLLSPRVKSGHFSMERPFQTLLGQLRDWPNGKKDAPDMCAMGIQLLDPYSSQLASNENEEGEPILPTTKLPKLNIQRRAP